MTTEHYNADYSKLRWMAKQVKANNPGLWRVLLPRHIVPPPGYVSPVIAAGCFASELELAARISRGTVKATKPQVDCVLMTWAAAEAGMPTYFVGHDLITDLALSDVMQDLRLGELEWPHDAMLFFLPERFQKAFFGRGVPFVGVCRIPAGLQPVPECVRRVVPPGMVDFGISAEYSGQWAYVFYAPVMFNDGKSVEYSGSWPMDKPVGDCLKEPEFIDGTYGNESRFLPPTEVPSEAEDLELLNKIFAVTLWMLLLLNGEPEQVELGAVTCVRKKSRKAAEAGQEKAEDDLWSPNVIGWRYSSPKEALGGTHASPRAHPRRGHWTRQPYGPGRTLRKPVWIKRLMVGVRRKEQP
jgi:hypothetical protein